jgi:hypothetical protein
MKLPTYISALRAVKVGWRSHSRIADLLIRIDTDQNDRGSLSKIFHRIGD